MTEENKKPDASELPDEEQDTEGHSMLLYEHGRTLTRERERDIEKAAREARMLEERKRQDKR